MERFVKRNAKVVVKPNVLTGRAPEYAVCTNPLVIGAIVRMCYEAGAAEVTVLDNPTSSARAAFQEAGLTQATQEAGGTVKYLSNRNFETVKIPGAEALTSWPLVTDVFEADTFINVPICKHHGGAGLTLATKNLMGIMGGNRGKIHTRMAAKLADLCYHRQAATCHTGCLPHPCAQRARRRQPQRRHHAQSLRGGHQPGGHRCLWLQDHGVGPDGPRHGG